MPDAWVNIAIQAGGALGMGGMFLFFLQKKQTEDRTERESEREMHQEAISEQMSYLRDRDQQSKEIAQSGHAALDEISSQVAELKTQIQIARG